MQIGLQERDLARGLLVSNTGFTTQVLAGLILDVYKNPREWLSKTSITMGVWNDIWSKQNDPHVGGWNELDWFVGINTLIAKSLLFGIQYVQFVSPPHHFTPENNRHFLRQAQTVTLGVLIPNV